MASSILHIKDAYYFEVPKALWRVEYAGIKPGSVEDGGRPFPDWLIRLDQSFLDWQAQRFASDVGSLGVELPDGWMADYHHWLHEDHANVGKPLAAYIEASGMVDEELNDPTWAKAWENAKAEGSVSEYLVDPATNEWGSEKVDGYNHALSGKILIPQPFGELRNLYQGQSGFCISKFMIIQVVVAVLLWLIFTRFAKRIATSNGNSVKGRFANALEVFLLFMRDQIARPAIGHDGDKYVPLLWTMFFFVLGMNLMGMIPWVGAPTGAFACTGGMAAVTFLTGLVMGSKKFGVVGYWLNQVPSMELPALLSLPIKGLLFVIEVIGLFIKHAVLAIRLLANMFAGHIVLLGIMGVAFSAQAAMSSTWWVAAPIAVIASTIFSLLELGVAFLQAYVFTFLSALFIGAATHRH